MLTIASLTTLLFSVLAVAASPSLDLKVTGPSEVNGVANLKLITTVTNTGEESVKLLNHPESVLDNTPTESFTVQHDDTGLSPKFIGIRAGYMADMVIKMDDPAAFTVLQPGKSVDVTHDLSSVYDFSKSGEGKYTFLPSTTFLYVDPTTSKAVTVFSKSVEHHLSLTGSLTPINELHPDASQASNCTAAQNNVLTTAANGANNLVNNVYSYTYYLNSPSTRFNNWFGPFNAQSKARVLSVFQNLSGRGNPYSNFLNFNYRCEFQNQPLCIPGRYAYVYFVAFPEVHICPYFFQLNPNDYPGFLTHEGTHFDVIGATRDYQYGEQNCLNLARSDPNTALYNADSFRFYAIYP